MAAKKNTGKSVSVELRSPAPKKSVVRFDSDEDGAAMTSAYISNDAIKELGGDPSSVKGVRLTIELL